MEKKTHCFQGHEKTPENTMKNGRCKLCAKVCRDKNRPEGLGVLCACGCGQYTGVYSQNTPKKGHVKGQPKKFLKGHGGMLARIAIAKRKKEMLFCKSGHPVFPGSRHPNGRCKECSREYGTKWREENPEKYRAQSDFRRENRDTEKEMASHRRRKYKLSPERFAEMLVEQGNKCAVCPVVFDFLSRETTPCVDHDHFCCSGGTTCGKCVRGLICWQCNAGLGSFKDDVATLANAIQYLTKFRETQTCQNARNTSYAQNQPEPILGAWVKPSYQELSFSQLETMA